MKINKLKFQAVKILKEFYTDLFFSNYKILFLQKKEIKKEIYLDNAATTKIDKRVFKTMLPYLKEKYGNPGSMHDLGFEAKQTIVSARQTVAKCLNCKPNEIIFTGSGTESDNLAIFGFCRKNKEKGQHIITSTIEHKAVLEPFKKLEKEGFKTSFVEVDKFGLVKLKELEKLIRKDTIFISIMYANNEIGTIENIKAISKICRKYGIVFHTDACQATNSCEMDVKKLGVDLMTLNGSKVYGPKGIGMLYKKEEIKIEPIIFGGGHEFGLRGGTENVPFIVGFAKGLKIVTKNKTQENKRLIELRDLLINGLLKIDGTYLNGHRTKRLPNNVNISFEGVEGESLMLMLNEFGIFVMTGSACNSKTLQSSYVIKATGKKSVVGHCSIRFTLGHKTTKKDIKFVIEKVKFCVKKLRKISAIKIGMKNLKTATSGCRIEI
jgi:cysteine desulfurase